MAVLARVLSGMDVRTEVSPDDPCAPYTLRAIVRSFACTIRGAGGLFATIFQSKVSVAGLAVKEDRRLELDGIAVSEVFINELVKNGLLDVTSVGFEVEPALANVFVATFAVCILYGSEGD